MAEQRSSNGAVKVFAAKMARDHASTTADVKAILASGKASASPPAGLDAAHQTLIAALKQAPAARLDKLCMDQQVAAHNAAVTLFKTYAAQGGNPALKAFAAKALPTIVAHLDMAQQLDGHTTMG